ncbi:TBC1 domain family member-like [Tropilaelaps mercedesae]|uniref:TBC1 domain family member-like n=1 Tax=Tropilaelaps mercedesae TaxID=418985 RepID=A0A1V9XQD9_9ACAR|nr:TBC1 domain family member-like [Tropilaelaps mercedesae]
MMAKESTGPFMSFSMNGSTAAGLIRRSAKVDEGKGKMASSCTAFRHGLHRLCAPTCLDSMESGNAQEKGSESGSPDGGSMSSSVSVDSSPCHRKLNGDLGHGTISIKDVSKDEIALLHKLEEQNRLLEKDSKSLSSLTSTGHSRRSSDTSQISANMNTNGTVSLSGSSGANSMDDNEDDILQQWGKTVQDYENLKKKKPDVLKDAVRKGIPPQFRAVAWQLLTNATSCSARELYGGYLAGTSPCEKVIRRDIARTYPEQEFFREKNGTGQEALFNVMKAYSLHDREVGYCQGSAFIVGLLLLHMPELETFTVLVRMMSDYRLREVSSTDEVAGTQSRFFVPLWQVVLLASHICVLVYLCRGMTIILLRQVVLLYRISLLLCGKTTAR